MKFRDVVLKRRMVRNFAEAPIAPEVIDRILDLARHAPSAGFTQGQSFIVVTQPETKQRIAELCGEKEYTEARRRIYASGTLAGRGVHRLHGISL